MYIYNFLNIQQQDDIRVILTSHADYSMNIRKAIRR